MSKEYQKQKLKKEIKYYENILDYYKVDLEDKIRINDTIRYLKSELNILDIHSRKGV